MERPSLLLSQTAPLAEKGNDGRFFLLLLIQTNLHQSLNFFHQDFFSDSNVDFFRPRNLKTVEIFFANVERNSWVFSFSYKKFLFDPFAHIGSSLVSTLGDLAEVSKTTTVVMGNITNELYTLE